MSRLFHIKNELITKTPMTKNSRCFIKMEMGKLISGTTKSRKARPNDTTEINISKVTLNKTDFMLSDSSAFSHSAKSINLSTKHKNEDLPCRHASLLTTLTVFATYPFVKKE